MTNPAITQLAADVRKSAYHQPAASKKLAKQVASDFHADLAGIPDVVIGEVLLRAAVFTSSVFKSNPGASCRDLSNLLAGAGQRLFHHPEARDGGGLRVEWRAFDYDNKESTRPPHQDLVWVFERGEDEVGLGFFDGFTFRMHWGTDDCSVSHWAPIDSVARPAMDDLEGDA